MFIDDEKSEILRLPETRKTIPISKKLHIFPVTQGVALGYRRGKTGGTWSGRIHLEGAKYEFFVVGEADDLLPADNLTIFTFFQAFEKVRKFWVKKRKKNVTHKENKQALIDRLTKEFSIEEIEEALYRCQLNRHLAQLSTESENNNGH